jgi:uncharacterized membrane protein YfcA
VQELIRWSVLIGAAILAGLINTVAGGGTLLTFPALLSFGTPDAVFANATSTTALVWGSLAGAWGYRRELVGNGGKWLSLLIWPSVLGGITGAVLLTLLPNTIFRTILPWLLLTAALLFLFQPLMARLMRRGTEDDLPGRSGRIAIVLAQFGVAVYGGYFGAGIGVLMLTSLGVMGLSDIHRANAVKTLLAAAINGVSVLIFIITNKIDWRFVIPMTIGAIAGGYLGAIIGRRLPKQAVRWFVILVAFGLAIYYFARG